MNIHEKINFLVKLTGTNNTKVSRELNVDPTLVSKWRTGARSPLKNLDLLQNLSSYFGKRICTEYHRQSLAKAMQIPETELNTAEAIQQLILNWFSQSLAVVPEKAPASESTQKQTASGLDADASPQAFDASQRLLSLKQFFVALAKATAPLTLWLYYDQPAQQMKPITRFLRRLGETNPRCLSMVTEIKVLLPAEINEEEGQVLIDSLYPFFGNSMIFVAHCAQLRHPVFHHIIMAAEGVGTFASYSLAETGASLTTTNLHPLLAQRMIEEFQAMYNKGEHFLDHTTDTNVLECFEKVSSILANPGDCIIQGNLISVLVTPPQVVKEVLDMLGVIPLKGSLRAMSLLGLRQFEDYLQAGNRCICRMPLLTPTEVENGKAALPQIPAFCHDQLTITPQRYLEILKNVEYLCSKYDNFVLYIDKQFFHDMTIFTMENVQLYLCQNEPHFLAYGSERVSIAKTYYNIFRDDYQKLPDSEKLHSRNLHLLQERIAQFEQFVQTGQTGQTGHSPAGQLCAS